MNEFVEKVMGEQASDLERLAQSYEPKIGWGNAALALIGPVAGACIAYATGAPIERYALEGAVMSAAPVGGICLAEYILNARSRAEQMALDIDMSRNASIVSILMPLNLGICGVVADAMAYFTKMPLDRGMFAVAGALAGVKMATTAIDRGKEYLKKLELIQIF